MKKIYSEVCKREGKKSQTSRANVMETINCLTDILSEESVAMIERGDKVCSSSSFTIMFLEHLHKKINKALKKKKLEQIEVVCLKII